MRRRIRDQTQGSTVSPTDSDAIPITILEMVSLIGIFEHAQIRISALSDVDRKTIASASGSTLIPSLYARAGLASSRGRDGIPLLASEIGLLEAAVINELFQSGH